jgi:hypothetical protein
MLPASSTLPQLHLQGYVLSPDFPDYLLNRGDVLRVKGGKDVFKTARLLVFAAICLLFLTDIAARKVVPGQTPVWSLLHDWGYLVAVPLLLFAGLWSLLLPFIRIRIDFDRARKALTIERHFLSLWSRSEAVAFAAFQSLDVSKLPGVRGHCLVLSDAGGRRAVLGRFEVPEETAVATQQLLASVVFGKDAPA